MTPILSCDLGHVSMVTLLQTIESASLTGRLAVDEAVIPFRNGQAVHTGDRALTLDAILTLFLVAEGHASFTTADVEGEPLMDGFALQMQGCRLADEWVRLKDAVLVVEHDLPLPDPLIKHLRGRAPLARALRRANLSWPAVADAVLAGLDDGALTVKHRHTEPEDAKQRTFDDWIRAGRAALRARDFDTAIQAFEDALALDPQSTVAAQNLRRTLDVQAQWSELA